MATRQASVWAAVHCVVREGSLGGWSDNVW